MCLAIGNGNNSVNSDQLHVMLNVNLDNRTNAYAAPLIT